MPHRIYFGRYQIRSCLYDPNQMIAVSQRLTCEGIKMEEFPQTSGNLTEAFAIIESIDLLERRTDLNIQKAQRTKALADLREGVEATQQMVLERCKMGEFSRSI